MAVLLQSTFFGPIEWYKIVHRNHTIIIEQYDNYCKQSYRNRCIISTSTGRQELIVPIKHSQTKNKVKGNVAQISFQSNWKHIHWQALVSAYGESPFFDFYAPCIKPLYDCAPNSLYEFNFGILKTICKLLDIHSEIILSERYLRANEMPKDIEDYREAIHPKRNDPINQCTFKPYYQVYALKNGFIENLSILDLLFNMGPESVFFL